MDIKMNCIKVTNEDDMKNDDKYQDIKMKLKNKNKRNNTM